MYEGELHASSRLTYLTSARFLVQGQCHSPQRYTHISPSDATHLRLCITLRLPPYGSRVD